LAKTYKQVTYDTTLSPGVADDSTEGAGFEGLLLNNLELGVGVAGDAVDAHDDGEAVGGGGADVVLQVGGALSYELELSGVKQQILSI